ncbi:MAG: thermostable hemolysin, partial [Variovorax sp.]
MAVSPHDGDPSPAAGAASERPALVVHGRDDPRRAEVEAFVRDIFARRYGAQVQQFAPVLVSLQDHGEIVAAAGYRSAADAPLFLERYLPSPVEALLAAQAVAQP